MVIEDDPTAASYLVKALSEAGHVADEIADVSTVWALRRRSATPTRPTSSRLAVPGSGTARM